jgi:hypothetical protein
LFLGLAFLCRLFDRFDLGGRLLRCGCLGRRCRRSRQDLESFAFDLARLIWISRGRNFVDNDFFLGLLLDVLNVDDVVHHHVVDDGDIAERPRVPQVAPVIAENMIREIDRQER